MQDLGAKASEAGLATRHLHAVGVGEAGDDGSAARVPGQGHAERLPRGYGGHGHSIAGDYVGAPDDRKGDDARRPDRWRHVQPRHCRRPRAPGTKAGLRHGAAGVEETGRGSKVTTRLPDHHRETDAHGIAFVGGAWAGDHGVGQRLRRPAPASTVDLTLGVDRWHRGGAIGEHGRDVPLHGQGAVQRGNGRRGLPEKTSATLTWTATERYRMTEIAAERPRPRPASASRSG